MQVGSLQQGELGQPIVGLTEQGSDRQPVRLAVRADNYLATCCDFNGMKTELSLDRALYFADFAVKTGCFELRNHLAFAECSEVAAVVL